MPVLFGTPPSQPIPPRLDEQSPAPFILLFLLLRWIFPRKTMSSDHSTLSSEKSRLLLSSQSQGTHKVKYHHDADWDFLLEDRDSPIDLSLILPHYRARHQPVDHRMSMFVTGYTEPIRLKVCRPLTRSRFTLSVYAETSNVTVWLPSDFTGRIRYNPSCKAVFSAGFVNKILQNARINGPLVDMEETHHHEDDVVIVTRGRITFRMWDVQSCSPENSHKETLKRLFFNQPRKATEPRIDWDCLLMD